MATKNPTKPKVTRGQVWRDRDKRQPGRWLVVVRVDSDTATCRVHLRGQMLGGIMDTGRETRVSLARFRPTSTGYELVARVGDDGAARETAKAARGQA